MNFSKQFLKSLPPGTRTIVKNEEEGDFEGQLHRFEFDGDDYTLTLSNLKKLGGRKVNPGFHDFESDEIDSLEFPDLPNKEEGLVDSAAVENVKDKEAEYFPLG